MTGFSIQTDRLIRVLRAYAQRLYVLRNGLPKYKQCMAKQRPKVKWMWTIPLIPTVHCWSIPGFGSWSNNEASTSSRSEPIAAVTVNASPKADGEKTKDKVQKQRDKMNPVIEEADRLYAANECQETYTYLKQYTDSQDAEIYWRLARAARNWGQMAKDKETMKELYQEGLAYVTKALEIDENNYACHMWYAILLNFTGELEGTRKKIENALTVKEHFMKAIELNPSNPTAAHSIGFWYYCFADLKWYERKIAAAFYGKLPSGTYQEALDYFLKAEEIDPGFYNMNLAMIGQTYMKLQDAKNAYIYLAKAYHQPIKTTDDKEAHALAEKLLRTLGVKGSPQLEAFSTKESDKSSQ